MELGDRYECEFWEAGCLLWVGAKDHGGLSYETVCEQLWGMDPAGFTTSLLERKIFLPMGLYQDDGYRVRVVIGDLNDQEATEWVAMVRWQLDLSCGAMLISGILGDGHEVDLIPDIESLDPSTLDCLECYVRVPQGIYQVEVYSYPPGDLSTGWGQIVNPQLFSPTSGIGSENLANYFHRTRPGQEPPLWITCDILDDHEATASEIKYVDFVVRLMPLNLEQSQSMLPPNFNAMGGEVLWNFRKPDLCPLGILANDQVN